MHLVPPGTSILEKLHSDEKYLGINFGKAAPDELDADDCCVDAEEGAPKRFPIIVVAVETRLECLFLVESSAENT